MKVRVDIHHDGEDHVIFVEGIDAQEVSKMIRGARDDGFYYVDPKGSTVLIGSDYINGGIITVSED